MDRHITQPTMNIELEAGQRIPIHFDRDWSKTLTEKMKDDGPWDNPDLFQLALHVHNEMMIPSFDALNCLKHISSFQPLPHQIETAQKVLNELHGKAILADEVGLGKTIEAGLVLKEYMLRGLVRKVLILAPSSLILQWTKELQEKFAIPAIAQQKEYMWQQVDILVASIDTAKRKPHCDYVFEQEYDLLIVDEAHKLKNHLSKNYAFVSKLKRKYCLLLTATPVQNELKELFHMVSLLKPGILGNIQQFNRQFMSSKRKTKNERYLQKLLNSIMIRNRRQEEQIGHSQRHVYNIDVQLSAEERHLYDELTRFARDQYRQQNKHHIFSLITMQREACSSREALYVTLQQMLQNISKDHPDAIRLNQLVELVKNIAQHSKAQRLLTLIRDLGDKKVIIFTEYKATQDYLQYILYQNGIYSVPFRGGYRRNKKDWMVELFKHKAQVLIATEAGGEGINLQFCQHVINYDLPWNPMRVEQRIGRVHRLGQQHDVHIYNLSTEGTIEQYILHLLYEKIDLFESVVGKLEQILDRLTLKAPLEDHLTEIFLDSSSTKEIEIKMKNLTSFIQSTQQHINSTDHIAGDA